MQYRLLTVTTRQAQGHPRAFFITCKPIQTSQVQQALKNVSVENVKNGVEVLYTETRLVFIRHSVGLGHSGLPWNYCETRQTEAEPTMRKRERVSRMSENGLGDHLETVVERCQKFTSADRLFGYHSYA